MLSPGFSSDPVRTGATVGVGALLYGLLSRQGGRRALGLYKLDPWKMKPQIKPVATAVTAGLPLAAVPWAANMPREVAGINKGVNSAFEGVNKAKAMVADAKDTFDDYRDYFKDPKEIGRDVGLSVGGGVAGYLGGNALGKGLAGLVFKDDEKDPYEKRRRNERIRNAIGAAGAVGLSLAGSLAGPLAYRKFFGKTAAVTLTGVLKHRKRCG